ncbi:MAG TPA: ImmA/IrrE family metallo-endopeptidase [Candidatus Nitrosocosmicus sp.]|nr:ImmA/IrrE family metallo-endopeptidase [Candidatus Nitrosocosmicus sp.]
MKLLVKASIIKWSRESTKIPFSAAVKKLGIKQETLQLWESQDTEIPIASLRKLADTYKRSLGIYFLDDIPQEKNPPTDFRKSAQNRDSFFSKAVVLVIRRVREIQSNIEELGLQKFTSLPLSARTNSDPVQLSKELRNVLNISLKEQYALSDTSKAYKYWKKIIEEKIGILTMEYSLPVNEVRAFSINHQAQPIIIINSKDEYSARIFSLFHELYHFMLGEEGLCQYKSNLYESNRIEKLCNEFSASFLVPQEELIFALNQLGFDINNTSSDNNIKKIASRFSVSRFVVLGRLLSLGLVSEDYYRTKYSEWTKDYNKKPKDKKGFGSYLDTLMNNNGATYTSGVLDAYGNKKISLRDVGLLLNTKLKNIGGIREKVMERYGRTSTIPI